MNDPDFDPNYNSIIVLDENIRIAGIPRDEIDIVRQILNGYAKRQKGLDCAIVVPNERQESFLKLNLELIGCVKFNIRIFQREDEALNWLKAQASQAQDPGRHRTSGESIEPPPGFFIPS
jgi:hypothetical protein